MKGISGGTAKPLLPPGGIWAWLSSRALLGAGQAPGKPAAPGHGPGGEGEDTGGRCLARTGKDSASPAVRSLLGVDREVTWEVEPTWREEHLLEGGSEAQGPRWEAQDPPGTSFSSQGTIPTGEG